MTNTIKIANRIENVTGYGMRRAETGYEVYAMTDRCNYPAISGIVSRSAAKQIMEAHK